MEAEESKRVDKRDRTARWVREQTTQVYDDPAPSPSTSSSPTMSRRTSSNRTMSSSDQSLAGPSSSTFKHRGVPPSPSHMGPIPNTVASVPPGYRDPQRTLPFPRSPPGSGYPVALEVVAPRAEPERPRRPSILKKRRPSLVDQVRSYSSMSIPWKRDEGGRRDDPGK